MEGTETSNVSASGMGAITSAIMDCSAGEHIVSSRTIYGGTYAFLKILHQNLTFKQVLLISQI